MDKASAADWLKFALDDYESGKYLSGILLELNWLLVMK